MIGFADPVKLDGAMRKSTTARFAQTTLQFALHNDSSNQLPPWRPATHLDSLDSIFGEGTVTHPPDNLHRELRRPRRCGGATKYWVPGPLG